MPRATVKKEAAVPEPVRGIFNGAGIELTGEISRNDASLYEAVSKALAQAENLIGSADSASQRNLSIEALRQVRADIETLQKEVVTILEEKLFSGGKIPPQKQHEVRQALLERKWRWMHPINEKLAALRLLSLAMELEGAVQEGDAARMEAFGIKLRQAQYAFLTVKPLSPRTLAMIELSAGTT